MAIVMIYDAPGMTAARADKVDAALRRRGVTLPTEGQLVHMAGSYNGGWRTVDVWESQEAADRFFGEHLSQAFTETGGIPEGPEPQVFPVHELYAYTTQLVAR